MEQTHVAYNRSTLSGLILILLVIFSFCETFAQGGQQVKITGTVIDGATGEPLPLANAYIPGTTVGVVSDLDGNFSLTVPANTKELGFNVMGYETITIPLNKLSLTEPNIIKMSEQNYAIGEIKVAPDKLPQILMRKILQNKHRNDPSRYNRTEFEKYVRWDYALNNITDRTENNILIRGAKDLIMTDEEDSTRYLPVYFSEVLSKNETQRDPIRSRSTILADNSKGIDVFKQYEIGGFSSSLDMDLSFYDDVIKILGAPFVSPISDKAMSYYKYYVVDSCMITNAEFTGNPNVAGATDSIRVYTLKFKPKTEGNKTFEGTMDVETKYHSIRRIDAKMPKTTNINFVKKLTLGATYQIINDSLPFYGTNEMSFNVDYMPVNSDKKRLEIRAHMFNSQQNIRVGMTDTLALSKRGLQYETFRSDNYRGKDEGYWESHRHVAFDDAQQRINQTIDSINNVKSVRAFNNVAKLALTGFLDIGKVELGPYNEVFNTNEIEGIHIGMGLRTSKEISENWMFMGVIGYGFKSTRPTYEAAIGYKFDSNFRQAIQISYYDRIARVGENTNILYLYENMMTTSENNLIAQLFKRGKIDELYYERKTHLTYEQEWLTGLQTKLSIHHLEQESPKFYPFTRGDASVLRIAQNEVSLDIRYSFKEKFLDDGLQRLYLSTDYPILHFTVAGGEAEAADRTSYYTRIHGTVKHQCYLGPTELSYAIEAGAYFGGDIPYSLLYIPRGNKTYGLYRYDFNMLDYMEFVADRYASIFVDYNLGGLLFNKMKLTRKLGFREVIGFKAMVGSFSERHLSMVDLPTNMSAFEKPYLEVNAGIDNVLRFFRFDAVWRVSDHKLKNPVGVRAQFNFKL
ncbi:MAG: DUF5686 family protein [Bacteroidia bacterium]|nr:DUF5686 family protein [Bacteroidia bacterium]